MFHAALASAGHVVQIRPDPHQILAPAKDPGRSEFDGRILRIVEREDPPEAVFEPNVWIVVERVLRIRCISQR